MEIACDESGFVGGSLFGGVRVFAHASLHVATDEAAALVEEVRRRTDAGPGEVKASRLNRPWARPVAAWLCGPEGPLRGRAVVHVTDTRLFGIARAVQLLAGDARPEGWWSADQEPVAWQQALALDDAVRALPAGGQELLDGVRDLLWINRRRQQEEPVDSWVELVRRTPLPDGHAEVLTSARALARIRDYVTRPPVSPLTEPLLPAVRWAVHHWGDDGDLSVVHDEQSLLTAARVEELAGGRVRTFRRVDSRDDARLQLADLVAGSVRRAVEDRLNGAAGPAGVPVDHLVADGSILRQR